MYYWKTLVSILFVLLTSYPVTYASMSLNYRQLPEDYIVALDWSPDDTVLAVVKLYGGLYLYNNNLEEIKHLNPINNFYTVQWSPDGTQLARATENDSLLIEIRDSTSLELIRVLTTSRRAITVLSWSPDGTHLAVGGGEIGEIFDVLSGELVNTLDLHAPPRTNTFVYVEWSPNGETIATNGLNNSTAIWEANTGQLLTTYTPSGDIAWSPDGAYLAVATARDIFILDGATGETITTFALQTLATLQVEWRANTLISLHPRGDGTSTINIINTSTKEIIDTIVMDESILAIALNSDGSLFAYGGSYGTDTYLNIALVPAARR